MSSSRPERSNPARRPAAVATAPLLVAAKFGGTYEIYWTIGPYDLVAISEFPDEESATAFALELGSQGNVRTTTLRAYNADEMRSIIAKTG